MMNNIKKYFSLIKYGYQFKTNLIFGIIPIILGIVELFFSYADISALYSVVMLVVFPMCIVQIMSSLEVASSVKTSSFYKKMYNNFPIIINVISTVIIDTLYICIRLYRGKVNEKLMLSLGNEFFLCGILLIVMYIFIAIAYKLFALGMSVCLPCMLLILYISNSDFIIISLNIYQGIIAMIICSAAAIIFYEIFHRLVYKLPLSKCSMGAFLRKYM